MKTTTHPSTARVLAGHVLVFVGRLSTLSRRQALDLVHRLGGTTADDITPRTTMVVIGSTGGARGAREPGSAEAERIRQRVHEIGEARVPVEVLDEEAFCSLVGRPSPGVLAQQFHAARDVRERYPGVRDDHLRYLQKWGLVDPVRAAGGPYYSFTDLLVIKQVSAELESGASFTAVVRSLTAARDGQLAFDFRPSASVAQPAKVVALYRSERKNAAPEVTPDETGDDRHTAAVRYFVEASRLDDSDPSTQDEAADTYRRALAIDPSLVPALVNLANIHYARDELIEAQALYERAIGVDPDFFEAHFNLGNIYHDLGRYADARACYLDAIDLNPSYPDGHFYLAVTLEKMGLSQEARPHWRAYQQLAPDGEWVNLAREFSE